MAYLNLCYDYSDLTAYKLIFVPPTHYTYLGYDFESNHIRRQVPKCRRLRCKLEFGALYNIKC